MATSEQLEHEAEATRARIAATLDELRGRMTPGQVVDQVMDYARDSGGGEFFRNLGRHAVDNPIPVTLVGAGLAWLMMTNRKGPGPDGAPRGAGIANAAGAMGERLQDTAGAAHDAASATISDVNQHAARRAHEWARRTRDTATRLNQGVAETANDLGETASAATSAVREATSAAYETAAERSRQGADAISRSAKAMGDGFAASSRNLMGFLQEQPLVLAGIGLAIGAMLGTSLPATELEDQLMGEASDAAKGEAKALADAELEKGKTVAEQAWSAAKPEIEAQLHGRAEGSRAGSAHEATLVPSEEAAQGEAAHDGARRDTEQPSG